jgi:16S rRNA processing protein RimM
MIPDSLTLIGNIIKPKHLQGAVVVYLDDSMFNYLANNATPPAHLFLQLKQQTKTIPYFIEKWDWQGQEVVLQLEDVTNRNDAENLRGANLYIETDKIKAYIAQEEEEEWDFLINYTIIDSNDTEIGTIKSIFYLPANVLAQVFVQDKEVLIPLHEDLIELLDEQQKIVVIDVPEGLIDLYLQ